MTSLRTSLINTIYYIEYIKNTKEYKSMYASLEEKNNLINVSDKQNKTFILLENNKKITVDIAVIFEDSLFCFLNHFTSSFGFGGAGEC